MIVRVHRSAQILCVAFTLLLAACSGGGGGDSGGGTPALSASTTSLSFTAIQNGSTPPAQQVVLTISGGTVFIGIPSVTGSTFSTSFAITGQTTGAITVTPVAPTLAPGTYAGTITVRGCLTDPCASNDVAGSPVVINVSYTIQAQTGFSASPQSFSLSQLQGGPAVAPQTLSLSDLNGGSYAWNASIVYQSGSGWLNINGASAASGPSLPASLSLSINSSLTPGTVNAIVHITGNGNSIDVPVSYTVSQAQVTPSPAQLTFNATNGGASPPTQSITLSTQGGVPVNYTTAVANYSAGASGWLNAPSIGTAPGTVTVGVGTTALTPGTYTATLVVSTDTQTISIGVTYVVATSSLTFNPSSASFTIGTASLPAALSQSVIVGSTGGSLNWTAASSLPWVTVSPASGFSGATVTLTLDPAQLDALDPGTSSATVTFSYTPPGASATSTPLSVSLNLLLPKVNSVTPYVATSGAPEEVILRGLGFLNAGSTDVMFNATAVSPSSYTVDSDTQIRVTHPSLAASSYRVSFPNQLGNPAIVRSAANLVVVDAPVYAATTIAYPDATAKQPLNIVYDAERQALLVGAGLPIAGAQNGSIYRYTFSGSAWSVTPATLAVSDFRDLALSLDGKKLIAVRGLSINPLDPITLAAGAPTSAPFSSAFFLRGVALANDGNAILTTGVNGGTGFSDVYRYSVGDGLFSAPVGSLYSAISGASADGSRAVFVQGGLSPPQNVFQYSASNSALSSVNLPLAQLLRGSVLDRRATRIVLNGNLVYDASFQQLGKIPGSSAVALSPDGSKAYAYTSGTLLNTYDLNGTLDLNGFFPEIGPPGTTLASDPGSNPVITISPDGGFLFIAGSDAIVVLPAP
jgi:hypothetical protein